MLQDSSWLSKARTVVPKLEMFTPYCLSTFKTGHCIGEVGWLGCVYVLRCIKPPHIPHPINLANGHKCFIKLLARDHCIGFMSEAGSRVFWKLSLFLVPYFYIDKKPKITKNICVVQNSDTRGPMISTGLFYVFNHFCCKN